MRQRMLGLAMLLSVGFLFSCNNGGGPDDPEPCPCEGVSDKVSQGDHCYCDQRRATGECTHFPKPKQP